MFEPSKKPRVFAFPPGCDFPREFVAGLVERLRGHPTENMASVEIFLNTRRSVEGVRARLVELGPTFLPRFRLIPSLASDTRFPEIPGPVSPLRRRLELAQAVAKLLEGDQRFGTRTAVFDLADSLATLMDELHSEGVDPDTLMRLDEELDMSLFSQHWQDSLRFLNIIKQHWGLDAEPDIQARQRLVVERICKEWREDPPAHPVIVAGSTGSRGATQLLMQTAATLPQGALVLPCFDYAMPDAVWTGMKSEEHPQYRFKVLTDNLSIVPGDIGKWREDSICNEDRNRLVSLALRPAPVTSQWMDEGPKLRNLEIATSELSLLEAPSQRIEAVAIALRLRKATEEGKTAALVTPDRKLSRQVEAALGRWGIVPMDGSGDPLIQTVPGRLLRQIADLMGRAPTKPEIIALLKHPLAHAERNRKRHLGLARKLEWCFRRHSDKEPSAIIGEFGADESESAWAKWLESWLHDLTTAQVDDFSQLVKLHRSLTERLVSDSCGNGTGNLRKRGEAGRAAHETMDELEAASDAGGVCSPSDYAFLFRNIASRSLVYELYMAHPGIRIWNTLDARMQRPDVVVAGGLNESVWPAASTPDPWLNRRMRKAAGLLMPERAAGLSAHDFQQVIAAPEVLLARSIRTLDTPTLPSRWISRLTSLLEGIEGDGQSALQAMRKRGQYWIDLASKLESPERKKPSGRPSPKPPAAVRPNRLSVTEIKTLISDPYAIYAKNVLKLDPLKPFDERASAMLRGKLVHRIFENFIRDTQEKLDEHAAGKLLAIAEDTLMKANIPTYAARVWLAEIKNTADQFVKGEVERRRNWRPRHFEVTGTFEFSKLRVGNKSFELVAKADRIDVDSKGNLALFDYKTGDPPSKSDIRNFDKQMPLMTKMIENGAFKEIPAGLVLQSSYLRVGSQTEIVEIQRHGTNDSDMFDEDWERFKELIKKYLKPSQGFTSRRYMSRMRYDGDYDHLARYGEWDETSLASDTETE